MRRYCSHDEAGAEPGAAVVARTDDRRYRWPADQVRPAGAGANHAAVRQSRPYIHVAEVHDLRVYYPFLKFCD